MLFVAPHHAQGATTTPHFDVDPTGPLTANPTRHASTVVSMIVRMLMTLPCLDWPPLQLTLFPSVGQSRRIGSQSLRTLFKFWRPGNDIAVVTETAGVLQRRPITADQVVAKSPLPQLYPLATINLVIFRRVSMSLAHHSPAQVLPAPTFAASLSSDSM